MDKAQIDAMRTTVGMVEKAADEEKTFGRMNIYINGRAMPVDQASLAVEGLQTLVDEAAAEAERAEGVAAGRGEEALRKILYALKDTAQAAVKNGRQDVRFYATEENYASVSRMTVFAAVQSIEAKLAAAPAEPAKPTEPTLEECVAAMNRADFMRGSDWTVEVTSKQAGLTMSVANVGFTGDWLIERERADAAKGGA
jgi:hypothetical protein